MKNCFALFIGFCLCLSACGLQKEYPEAMQQAIRCLDTNPDSARFYLASISSNIPEEPEETRMYHALLTLRAEDKLYVRQTSDSLIKSIVTYYNKQGDTAKRLEAYYMLGRIYRDLDEPLEALKAFQEAADLGKKTQQYDLLGRVYEQKMYVFSYQNLLAEASEMANKSYDYYCMQKDTIGITYALRNKARLYSKINQKDSMEICYQKAVRIAFNAKDTLTAYSILRELAAILADLRRYDDSEKALAYIPEKSKKENAITLYNIARIHLYRQQEDSARDYLLKALQAKYNKNIYLQKSIYQQLSSLSEKQGEVAQALRYERTCAMLKDSIAAITQTEAIYKIHALYNYQKIKQEKDRLLLQNEHQQKLLYLSLLILLGIGILISWGIRQFKQYKQNVAQQKKELANLRVELEREKETEQKQEHELQKNQTKIEELELLIETARKERDEKTETCQQLQRQISQLEISNRHIRLNMDEKALARQEKELRKQEMRQSAIYLWFHEESHWEHIPEAAPQWEELRNLIKDCFPQFIVRLHTLYPKISEMELRTCFLLKLEIPLKAFPKIMNKASASAISNLRIRLYKKLFNKEGTASELDEFISDL